MKTKDLSNSKKKIVSDISLLEWFILAAVVLFLFIFPFQIALFNGFSFSFEAPLLESFVYAFVLLLVIGIRLLKTWEITDYRTLLSVLVFLLPIMYFIPYWNAVSVHSAKIMLLLEFMLAVFFLVGMYFAEKNLHGKIIELTLQLSGYMIVIYGLMNLFGQATSPQALWLSSTGYRLTSVFQYPNSYAALLTALFLAGVFSAVNATKWYWRALHLFMLVPIWISFMLTYSRAALVFIPILVLIILLFLRPGKQLRYLIYMLIAIVSSFAILGKITMVSNSISSILQPASGHNNTLSFWNHLPFEGWGLLIGVSVLLTAVSTLIHSKLSDWLDDKTTKLNNTKWSHVAIPALFVIIGALAAALVLSSSSVRSLLPDNIASRLDSINLEQNSVLERETFYKDAIKAAADYPLFGAGGGAWSVIYEKYQNNPYTSRQAHSFFLQTLVETGWLGLIVLIAFLAAVYALFIRAYIKNPSQRSNQFVFFIVSLSILVHSSLDFDMSYGYLAVIVFLCLGAMLAPAQGELKILVFERYKHMKWRFLYPVSISMLAIILIIWSYREYSANLNYQHAVDLATNENKPLSELLPYIDRAIKIAPDDPDYTLRKMDWMQQAFDSTHDASYRQEYNRLLNQLQPFEPYNRSLMLYTYRYLKDEGQYDKVLQKLDESVKDFPWDMNFYEAAIMEYYLAGQRVLTTDSQQSNNEWNRSLGLYNEVVHRMELLKSLPAEQLQGREFDVSQLMRQAIGQIYFYNKNYQEAINLLKIDITGDMNDPGIRINTRYYLASLNAIGQSDDELFKKLVSADPNEANLLNDINKKIQ
ncbi:hypothetical protein GZH47_12325 [Paenibacillus rhizovicinus]|uniref:O-antigen ligase-related domain-containing protein n=1 Tax=Paenibacillus rhizovicinus TaxID=2704463 RepID=A0A6C0NZL2_9BACL|nr:O-antigen ligase family protein [Paenibacillus rhizovicinus]QHW31551.1 hypothetical protein GZH47_12325 [Paenibacillus rhizovicinus]